MSKLKPQTLDLAAAYYFSNSTAKDSKAREARYNNHIKSVLGSKLIEELVADDMNYLIFQLNQKELAPAYIDNMIAMIQAILNKVQINFTDIRISLSVKATKKQYKSDQMNRIFTPEELQQLILSAHDKDPQLELIIKLLYLTAARPSGLLSLIAADVDFNTNTITLPGMKGAGIYDQPMQQQTKDLLLEHIKVNKIKADEHLFIPKSAKTRNYPMHYEQLEVRCRVLFKQFNINVPKQARFNKKRVSLYTLRHTRITDMAKDISPAIVQKFVNHSTIQTTEKYINIDTAAIQAAISKNEIMV